MTYREVVGAHWARETRCHQCGPLAAEGCPLGLVGGAQHVFCHLACLTVWADARQTLQAVPPSPSSPEPRCALCGARQSAHLDVRDGVPGHTRGDTTDRPPGQQVWHPFTPHPGTSMRPRSHDD